MGIRFGIPHILIFIVFTIGIAVLSRAQLRERPATQATVAARMVRDVVPQTEMAVDATVLEVDRMSLADVGFGAASTFIMNISDNAARSLAGGPHSKVLQSFQLSTLGSAPAQFRVSSSVGSNSGALQQPSYLDAGLDFQLETRVSVKREIALTLSSRAKINRRENASSDVVNLFTGQWVRLEITTAEGASIAAAGFVSGADRMQLAKVAALQDSPILKYLFAKGVDNPTEIVVLLSPRVVRAPPLPTGIERTGPATAPITQDRYTLQVGAFHSQANAVSLLAVLGKRHPEAFIDGLSSDAAVYRVRVGRFSDLEDVKQLEKQLRSEGFNPLVLALK